MTDPRTPTTPEGETEEILDTTPDTKLGDAARRLSENARSHLISQGYSDGQIRQWAEDYVSEGEANANLAGFLEWVATRNA